jgi:plasmid stability protein
MTGKMLTIRMSEDEHRALKLYAVLQGRSVNAVVTDLIRAELARQSPAGPGRSREEFAAELLARFGIDPDGTEHRAAAERARADVQREASGQTRQGAMAGRNLLA